MVKHTLRLPDGFTIDRERLAWAAGFFDGEGSSFSRLGRNPRLAITQATDDPAVPPEVLIRFRDATGIGTIRPGSLGPNAQRHHRPRYEWCVQNFEATQAVIAMLWPWLGTVKREQAIRVLRATPMPLNRYGVDFCANGHRNPERSEKGTCLECRRAQKRRQYQKRKADRSLPIWQRTHCIHGHELDKVGRLLDGQCLQCRRDEARRYRAAHPDRHRRRPEHYRGGGRGNPPAQERRGDA